MAARYLHHVVQKVVQDLALKYTVKKTTLSGLTISLNENNRIDEGDIERYCLTRDQKLLTAESDQEVFNQANVSVIDRLPY